jgi:outer membrane protein W
LSLKLKIFLNTKDTYKSMKKYTILAWMLLVTLGCVYAQDTTTGTTGSSDAADYAPAAGDITGAILLGRGNYLNSGLAVPASANLSWTVPGTAPYNNTLDPNSNDITNMVGAEVRYFLMDNIALKLSGGAIIRNTPSQTNVPGFVDSNTNNAAWIPAYAAVQADNRVDMNINLGGEYHFTSKYSRLFPYAGVTIPFYYARQSYYDPTINLNGGGNISIVDVGVRSAEIVGFGGQLVGGVDYYLMEGFYFGFEIKPVSVVYAYSVKSPGPGLEAGEAENTAWSFFSQPFLKFGFRF